VGVGSYVKDLEHKRYEQTYDFYSTDGIERLLRDIHKLQSRAYEKGDFAAIDITVDLNHAINAAGLTDKQREAIDYLYIQDMKIDDAAKLIGVNKSTLSRNKEAALRKIAAVFKKWNYIEE
jgi:DNA-directed RNA polymerase specialized sigma24 family protein